MKPVAITNQIFWIGINDERTKLFEGLWPIQKEGISYNSYLIQDERSALIDLCKELYQQEYLSELGTLISPSQIKYLVMNHLEPDHSGAITAFRKIAPQTTILCTEKAIDMLRDFFGIQENIRVVKDGEEVSLGSHTLRFISAPMVHWPETMLTYETSTQTLFSCDAFGGYGKLKDGIFDDETHELPYYEQEALRYFANIVAAFSKPVLNAGAKLAELNIRVVAPSHGLVWRKDPGRIISLYQKWSGYSKGIAEKGVTLLSGSMYGNTDRMTEAIEKGLLSSSIKVDRLDIRNTHISYILPALWCNQGVVIGAPTYEGSLFPTMVLVLKVAEFKRVFRRDAVYFGSYGWGGGAMRYLDRQLKALNWTLFDSLDFPGSPCESDLISGEQLGKRFGEYILSL